MELKAECALVLYRSLIAISREFGELAEVCLLVLHLEVRVHCFFYLIPLAFEVSYLALLLYC